MWLLEEMEKIYGPVVELAIAQTDRDFAMLENLIEERKKQFPTLAEFSETLGVSEEKIDEFESDPDSFSVGFVRLYAIGVHAAIHHHIETSTVLEEKRGWERKMLMKYIKDNVTAVSPEAWTQYRSTETWKQSLVETSLQGHLESKVS